MIWQYNPYIWLPILAAFLSAALGITAWLRRETPGARLFGLAMLVAVCWALTYALQLASRDLTSAFFWLGLQMLGPVLLPVVWLAMTLQYTGREGWLTRGRLIALLVVPVLSLVFLYTDFPPHWMAREAHMEMLGAAAMIHVQPGPWFWIHSAYEYGLVAVIFVLLLQKTLRMPRQYRSQPLILVSAVVVLMVLHLLYMVGLFGSLPVNPTTLLTNLAYIVLAWGIFRYRLFDIMPVAATRVMESMSDALIVLDGQDRVINLNPAAQRLLARSVASAMGEDATRVLASWPELVVALQDGMSGAAELSLGTNGQQGYYEVNTLPLTGGRGRRLGRLVTLRDITRRKQAEEERERLIGELQKALAEVKTLSGLLPVCAWCGKMRTDEGYWQRLDVYLSEHSDLQITHSICPDCLKNYEKQLDKRRESSTR